MAFRIQRKIHVWGGLGSQLYGLNLYIRLNRESSPFYTNILVLHSGGVTERQSELGPFLDTNDQIELIDDFKVSQTKHRFKSSRFSHRSFVKAILRFLGVLSCCDTESELSKIRPWCIEIRGHYSQLEVTNESIKEMIERAKQNNKTFPQIDASQKQYSIHLRKGDLAEVKPSSSVSDNIIFEIVNKTKPNVNDSFLISSDSLEFAIDNFKTLSLHVDFLDTDSWSTVCLLANSKIFIGTNSKLSQWVCIFRNSVFPLGKNFLPKGFEKGLAANRSGVVAEYY